MPLIKGKSSKAFSDNVATEMDSGKPQKRALAIAYSVKRQAAKKKKMASGGPVEVDFASEVKAKADNSRTPEELHMLRHKKSEPSDVDVTASEEHHATADDAHTKEDTKMMAKGGYLASASEERRATADDAITDEDLDMLESYSHASHPETINFHDERRPSIDSARTPEEFEMYAEGGSIAERIMKKRKMMADGGEVDLDLNAMEQPNEYYRENRSILKENYDEPLHHVSQPKDSNEHGDDIESDKHDRISKIRAKMKKSY